MLANALNISNNLYYSIRTHLVLSNHLIQEPRVAGSLMPGIFSILLPTNMCKKSAICICIEIVKLGFLVAYMMHTRISGCLSFWSIIVQQSVYICCLFLLSAFRLSLVVWISSFGYLDSISYGCLVIYLWLSGYLSLVVWMSIFSCLDSISLFLVYLDIYLWLSGWVSLMS